LLPRVLCSGSLCCLLLLAAEAPPPGALNAFEGAVRIDGVAAGAGQHAIRPGQVIRTGDGMAELLLAPGAFLRLGGQTEWTFETGRTPGQLNKGEALLEILALPAPLSIEQNGATIAVRAPGLYDFNRRRGRVTVYSGELQAERGGKQLTAGAGFNVAIPRLNKSPAKARAWNALYSWSSLRSAQLSSESKASAQSYPGGAANWHGPAWYWDDLSGSYTFLSASGFVTGPFGWPYYSPGYAPDYFPVPAASDSHLYGPPVIALPNPVTTFEPERGPATPPAVPLTAPGEPRFPGNR